MIIYHNFQGTKPSCGLAEGGLLLFGDNNGYLYISDRNLQLSEQNKHRLYQGPLLGISYIFDSLNHYKQYIIVIGKEAMTNFDEIRFDDKFQINTQFIIKVFNL